jgi:CubicO group peptidase (beta-lactamase class C family)
MGVSFGRAIGAGIFSVLAGWLTPLPCGADQVWPSTHWAKADDPAALGWSMEKLKKAEEYTQSYAPTAVMVVQDGKVIASWGDVSHKVNVRSVRKSLLSALVGIGVTEGRIRLDETIGELGIDDRDPGLTATEKQATIRDLLMSRSGIYHAAAYEAPDAKAKRPQRGSHLPGTFWYYNNWDFNALGFIYQKLVDNDVFRAFEQRIATPIGMEDFTADDGKFVFESSSDYPAYTFRLTGRDLARFGWLFLNHGIWSGVPIVPADWVDEATKPWSNTDIPRVDYGYLWWISPAEVGERYPAFVGSYRALGYDGQALVVVPRLRLVVVQLVDVKEGEERIGGGREWAELLLLVSAAAGS